MRQDEQPAFDVWLKRGLVETFAAVLREPIPDELARLVNKLPPDR